VSRGDYQLDDEPETLVQILCGGFEEQAELVAFAENCWLLQRKHTRRILHKRNPSAQDIS
jgi:hypothetical protein